MNTVRLAEPGLTEFADRILVSPSYGRFVPAPVGTVTSEGEVVCAGDVLGEVVGTDGSQAVEAPCDGWVLGYLVRDGERVRPGRPLVHLRRL